MPTKAPAFTYSDYLCLDDNLQHEVLEGELVMVPAPSWRHQETSKRLFLILQRHVEGRGIGVVQYAPLDVVLSEEIVVQPDLVFIAKERLAIVKDAGVFGPPDLVVEIVSPAKKERDTVVKKRLYERYGVREYWIVDIEKSILEVLASSGAGLEPRGTYGAGETVLSPLLPDLRFEVADLFR